jgi:hypothetical protein
MQRGRAQKKDILQVIIDLERAYDKVTRNVIWWALHKHKVSTKYIALIKDVRVLGFIVRWDSSCVR